MPFTGIRTIWPPAVISMISSVSRTVSAPTTPPVLSPVFIVMMPLPPRDLDAVFVKAGAFADAILAGDQQRRVGDNNRRGDEGVAGFQADAAHAARRAAHRAHVGFAEADAHAILGDQHHVVARITSSFSTMLPRVNFTSIRVSPGSMPMAMMPPLRTLENSLSEVFFTVPSCVAKNSSPDC